MKDSEIVAAFKQIKRQEIKSRMCEWNADASAVADAVYTNADDDASATDVVRN